MTELLPFIAAFVAGIMGGVHCVGMCGGIVGALAFGLPAESRERPSRLLPFLAAYNLGRIVSYCLAGLLMGGLGMLLAGLMPIYYAQRALLALAGVFMVLMGLYLAGWWMWLTHVERLGLGVWRRLEPVARRLLPVASPAQAFKVGMIWGWVPCGLVYTMLVNAVASGGALKGGMIMLAFGLGTLPNLLLMGWLAGAAAHLAGSGAVRAGAGVVMVAFGIVTLISALP